MTCLRLWCVSAAVALAQPQTGSIAGAITGPAGETFAVAFADLKNTATGESVFAQGADGRYAFEAVPPGAYDLSVSVPGMKPYTRAALAVVAGQNLRIDVRLEHGPSLGTLGEDPDTIAAVFINRPPPPSGPPPRTADGRPDFNGVWLGGPAPLPELDMLPWAEALTRERTANHAKDHPMAYCLPSGPVPVLWPGWFEIVQAPARLVMLFESDTPGYREVYLDGRSHPEDFGPAWLGHSTGTWEGDTLVIDTAGFHGNGWIGLDGQPHSERLHVIQRIRRPGLGQLEIEITVDDPGAFRKPWTVVKEASLAPEEEIQEAICNENNQDAAHMVGK